MKPGNSTATYTEKLLINARFHPDFRDRCWLWKSNFKHVKNRIIHSNLFQQRFTLMMALLFCLFISSVEYVPQNGETSKTEQASKNQDQTFINVAVDAVVPFILHVADTVLYLIYQVFSFEFEIPSLQAVSAYYPNQLVEILFERIISTKGPWNPLFPVL